MFQAESDFIAYRLGLMDDESWGGRREAIKGYADIPCYVRYWESVARNEFRADFVSEVDQIWAGFAKAGCPL